MDDLRKNNISESIRDIGGKIAQVDENLAGIFRGVAESILIAKDRCKETGSSFPIGEVIEDAIKSNIRGGRINTIPFGDPTPDCLEHCLAVTFGKIKSKNGFISIAKRVNDYWLRCSGVNSVTIILTDAWDINEFNPWFRESFNEHTSSRNGKNIKHTVAIILYGDFGFSLQYLR